MPNRMKTVLVCDCIRDDGKPDPGCRSYAQCSAELLRRVETEWRCPHCKSWRSVRDRACTHAVNDYGKDPVTGERRVRLGLPVETWAAERKPEYETR